MISVPVTIENDCFTLDVWPQFGGKVSSIVDKADGYELLFSYPAELPTRCQYGTRYNDSWYAGWDECFPAIAAGAFPAHPYEGVNNPDHGELWSLPTTAVPTRDGITTVWHGLRFGYRLTRKLYLDGPSIVAEYTLVNLAPFEFPFAWAQHAMFSLQSPVRISLGELPLTPAKNKPDAFPRGGIAGSVDGFEGLDVGGQVKRFTRDPVSQTPAVIEYPQRRRRLVLAYQSESQIDAYWGIWLDGANHHFGIEPTTGRSDSLHHAVDDGSAARVPVMGRVSWATRLTVGVA